MIQQPTWFSEEQYYADKATQARAMGYDTDAAKVKTALEAQGGAWAHYQQYGYKETYVENGIVKYIPLRNAAGDVIFDPQVYATSKLDQLNGINQELASRYATWQDLAKAIGAQGTSLYEHYIRHGQSEGLSLNEDFNSGMFFQAKLNYLNSHPELGTWDLQGVHDFFASRGMDAYTNWLEHGEGEGISAADVGKGVLGGETFRLTTGYDDLVGGNGNDTFYAPILGDENTLNTGDTLDGGGGRDTLNAYLAGGSYKSILAPVTNNIEVVKFRVQEQGGSTGSNNVKARVDAEFMKGVEEFWSSNSRDDLSIEDVRIDSNLVTVGMQSTDPGQIDYEFYFRSTYLKADSVEVSGDLFLELIDSQGELNQSAPLLDNPFNKVLFVYNGELYEVEFDKVSGADATYEDLRAAIETAIQATAGLEDVTVELGGQFEHEDAFGGGAVFGRQIVLKSESGVFSAKAEDGAGWGSTGALPPTNSTSATMRTTDDKGCPLYQTDIALDDVGSVLWDDNDANCLPDNDIFGSSAGNMIVGSMGTRDGVQRFDVTVDRGSWLNSLSSTNNQLRLIQVNASKDWNGDGVKGEGQLFIGSHLTNEQTYNVANMVSWQEKARALGHQVYLGDDASGDPIYGKSGIWDVKHFDATAHKGNVNIAAQFTAESYKKYLADVDGLRTLYGDYAPKGDFYYAFGEGSDTLNMLVNGGIAADQDFILGMNMGAGNDLVNFNFDFTTGNQVVDQVNLSTNPTLANILAAQAAETLKANVTINAEGGDDIVWTWGVNNADSSFGGLTGANLLSDRNVGWDGYSGALNIAGGAGDDTVYAAQDMNVNNAVWVLNANTNITNENPLGIYYDAVGEAQPINNNVSSTVQTWTVTAGAASTAYDFYVAVNFLGIEVKVKVGSYTSSAGGTYTVSAKDINNAVISAIENNATLSKLLVAKDGAGNSLLIMSLIDGEFGGANDFRVRFYEMNGNVESAYLNPAANNAAGVVNYVNQAQEAGYNYDFTADVTFGNPTSGGAAGETYSITVDGVVVATYDTLAGNEAWATIFAALDAAKIPGYTLTDGGAGTVTVASSAPLATAPTSVIATDAGGSVTETPTVTANDVYVPAAGEDNHYYGYTVVDGGAGNDVISTGYANSIVNAGDGRDTIIVGNETFNDITGGKGGDTIILGNVANANGAYDIVRQGKGDTDGYLNAKFTDPAVGNDTLDVSGLDVIFNFDTGTAATGDHLYLSDYTATSITSAGAAGTTYINTAGLGAGNRYHMITGTYDAKNGTFVFDGSTNDMLLVYDADASTTAVSWEAVVLVGRGNTAITVTGDTVNGDSLTVA